MMGLIDNFIRVNICVAAQFWGMKDFLSQYIRYVVDMIKNINLIARNCIGVFYVTPRDS